MPPDEATKILEAIGGVRTELAVLGTKFDAHTKADAAFYRDLCKPARDKVDRLEKAKTRSLGWLDVVKMIVPLLVLLRGFKYMGWI